MEFAEFDRQLTDPDQFRAGVPHEIFRRLRAEDPFHWTVGNLSRGFWSVTRHKDIEKIDRDPVTFSSERQGIILPPTRESEAVPKEAQGCGMVMFATDPPKHRDLRRIFDPKLAEKTITNFESCTRRIIKEVVASAPESCDFVQDLAMDVPSLVICEFMGIPEEDRETLLRWAGEAIFPADEDLRAGSRVESEINGWKKIGDYAFELALKRRKQPTDDLTSTIANGRIDGELLSDIDLSWNVTQFITGGLETTRNAITGGMLGLLQNPEQMQLLRSDPTTLMKDAAEEMLRWSTPLTHNLRTATRDVEFNGHQIKENDWVVLWLASANRDEDVFADPFKFDITRKNNRHLAFGHGPHFCIGRLLARLEIKIVFEELLRTFRSIELAGPVEYIASNLISGLKKMPVRLTR
jgi:cholest-4-en-3-one 26-monooxygenase